MANTEIAIEIKNIVIFHLFWVLDVLNMWKYYLDKFKLSIKYILRESYKKQSFCQYLFTNQSLTVQSYFFVIKLSKDKK